MLGGAMARRARCADRRRIRQSQLSRPATISRCSAIPTLGPEGTAIVNGDVITATEVDQRLALIVLANGGQVPAEEMQILRAQVLRNLVDETLQIQAAAASDIKVEPKEIDRYFEQYAKNFRQSPQQFISYLRAQGSSDRSIKRQIHGEIAWARLLNRKIEPSSRSARKRLNPLSIA
jgi:peptidyl-prolyl cis-trans isomerase SurA